MTQGIRFGFGIVGAVVLALLGIVMLSNFERPPVETVQRGFRGVAMEQNYTQQAVATFLADNQIPAAIPSLGTGGPKAAAIYKNVPVLGDLSVGQFTRLMVSITKWVSPTQGCAYCHNIQNMAEDSVYTKIVARRMLQMTQHINADYKTHVAETGVTCYTCHRGQPVPAKIWFNDPGPARAGGMAFTETGQNHPAGTVGDSSLPYDPFTPYFEDGAHPIRVQGIEALPDDNRHSIKETEWTYALMMHFSQSLGVNCTYCHNSRAFGVWSESTPQRQTAWYGIGMVRDLNEHYLNQLQNVFPAARLGPEGDAPKVNCATCHQGAYKPLLGVSMVSTYPSLQAPGPNAATAPVPPWMPETKSP